MHFWKKNLPGERSEPWQVVNAVDGVTDVDDLREALHLNSQCLQQIK